MQFAEKKCLVRIAKHHRYLTYFVTFKDGKTSGPPICGSISALTILRIMFVYYLIQLVCKIPFNLYIANRDDYYDARDESEPWHMALQAMIGTILVLLRICTLFQIALNPKDNDTKENRACLVTTWYITTIIDFAALLFCICLDYVIDDYREEVNKQYAVMYLARITIDVVCCLFHNYNKNRFAKAGRLDNREWNSAVELEENMQIKAEEIYGHNYKVLHLAVPEEAD